MFSHYLTIALRHLRRAPFTALINIFTLALGLVSFVAAYAVVGFWRGADQHFTNAERTYVITASLALRDGSISTGTAPQTNELYERYLRTEFPEFEAIAKVNVWSRESSVTADGKGARVIAMAVDPEFLDIFDLPLIAGDIDTALRDPSSVLLSEAAAVRLFGSTDVIGRTITLGGNLIDATVSGVVGPIPEPSHMGDSAAAMLRFELIAPYELYRRLSAAVATASAPPAAASTQPESAPEATPPTPPPEQRENWLGGYCCTTYVMLRPDSGITLADLNTRLEDFAERHMQPEMVAMASVKVGAVPMSGMMVTALDSQLLGSAAGSISITTLLFATGALVLGVACVNYASLATARALRRAREIGLRKVVGARRGQVVFQYLFEAALLAIVALAVAIAVVYLLAPTILSAVGIDLRLALGGIDFWLFIAALLATVTLLGGGYPALLLSRVRPIEALRLGRMRLGPRFISTLLIGTQFTAASLLVIAVLVMYSQNVELRRTGLGAVQDPYLIINNFGPVTGVGNELLWEELRRMPQVKGVTQMGSAPWSDNVNLTLYARTQEEGAPNYTAFWNTVGYDFFSTLDIPLVAGRVFDRERNDMPPQNGADLSIPRNVVIDRAFAQQLGFATPEDAIDVLVYEPSQFGPERPVQIIGVVESRPLYLRGFGATANAYGLGDGAGMINQVVRLDAQDVSGGLAALEETWLDLGAQVPIQRRFMDEMFEENYRNFARINQAFAGLAAFAITISLIGLFGMAVQTASRRIHEIGVRKSLGAETSGIVAMLLYDFTKPVLIANLLAWPLAYFAARAYLSIFLQRAELTLMPFVLSLVLVLTVAWMAVGSQALRAARIKPATVLRNE